jgi:hypothetical protein
MKKIIASLVIAFFTAMMVFAEKAVPTKEDLDQFYKTKTLVVLEDNPMLEYNFIIQDLIKNEWKLTEYEFISHSDFEAKRMDPQYSFLIMLIDNFQADKTKAKYKFLHLLLGGDYFRLNQMPDLGGIPIAYDGVEEQNYIYKFSTIIRLMQEHIRVITKNPDLIGSNIFKYYKDNMGDIKQKTLYVLAEELAKEVNTIKRIQKVYSHRVKIVTREEIQEAIENKNDDVVFLHKVGPEGTKLIARCYKLLVSAGEKPTLYYFDYHMISDKKPDGFLEKDFENLEKEKKPIL